jgi:predicted Zn finger-like uncharacterized protein
MYTQCPDCGIALRVSAKVLKQAAGKVRCGGCGNVFSALENLTEKKPSKAANVETKAALPELTPDLTPSDDGDSQAISSEQGADLLKTLDKLAGPDIRIEDTGVEWRVLDDAEDAESAADDGVKEIFDHPGKSNVDELLVESVTPVDEILTATIVETSIDELRFDDNTPLPDDFGHDDASSGETAPANNAESVAEAEELDGEDESTDLEPTLSEPGEWEDILGEFDDDAEEDSTTVEDSVEGDTAVHDPEAQDPDEIISEDSDDTPDMDSQFALQAEAMGIDLSDIDETDAAELDSEEEETESEVEVEDEEEVEALELESDDAANDDFDLAPQTEDEKSMNMMIDQELFSLATEDEDGFASTIVIAEEDAEDKAIEEQQVAVDKQDESIGFEEIVMEGAVVRTTLSDLKREADAANAADLAGIGGRTTDDLSKTKSAGISNGVIGGLVALILLLVIQIMHQSREALATIPAFNGIVGPIYRALGQPLQPAWDITGWRFEATKGSTDQNDAELTIYSRIGNKSDGPLPYPLIGISLTDRFEETIGSRVLDPAEYLATDLDPRKLVEPGNTFNAVISIQSPSDDATGFKLNVCYRLSGELLRCAIDDFK